MPGMNTLTHIVYCVCSDLEFEDPYLTESEQYETQLNELLREEKIVKKIVFNNVLAFVKEEEQKEYLRYVYSVLTALNNLLKDTIANNKGDENPSVILLQLEAQSVIQRLTAFFNARFSVPKPKKTDNPVAVEMFKLPLSVPIMATLTKAVIKANGVPEGMAATVIRFIIRHFSSVNTDKISYDSFRKQYNIPEANAINEVIIILEKVIRYLKNL